jgi:hypothetical protein
MTDSVPLRVLSCDVAGLHNTVALATLVRSLAPDVVVLQHGPRRLRWRTRGATLANQFGLVVGGGGEPALGNLILVSLRVAVRDTTCVQFPLVPGRAMGGAALVHCTVRGESLVVAGTAVTKQSDAVIVDKVLSEVDVPVILAASFDHGSVRTTLARGRTDAGSASRTSAIFVSPSITVKDCREVAIAGAVRPPIMAALELPVSFD